VIIGKLLLELSDLLCGGKGLERYRCIIRIFLTNTVNLGGFAQGGVKLHRA
jgi:hypothetical protein